MLMSGDRDALRVGRMVEARVRGVSVRVGPCRAHVQRTVAGVAPFEGVAALQVLPCAQQATTLQ